MQIRTTVLLAILLMLTVVNAKTLRAQSGTSSAITGRINDATGAVVPNAIVKATELSTGGTRTAQSNAEGRFLFALVNPGTYRIPGVPMYQKSSVAGVTVSGTKQWLNREAFVSVVDPTTGACVGGDSPTNCQFGNSGRNSLRGPHYTNSDVYISKTFPIKEGVTFRLDAQMFNAFNHPNFALPSEVEAGVPGVSVPARFGTLESTISPPLGVVGRWAGRRQLATYDCVSGKDRILTTASLKGE